MNKMLEKTMQELNASLNQQTVILHSGHEQIQFVAEVIPSAEVQAQRKVLKLKAVAKNAWTIFYQSTMFSVFIISVLVAVVPAFGKAFEKALGF